MTAGDRKTGTQKFKANAISSKTQGKTIKSNTRPVRASKKPDKKKITAKSRNENKNNNCNQITNEFSKNHKSPKNECKDSLEESQHYEIIDPTNKNNYASNNKHKRTSREHRRLITKENYLKYRRRKYKNNTNENLNNNNNNNTYQNQPPNQNNNEYQNIVRYPQNYKMNPEPPQYYSQPNYNENQRNTFTDSNQYITNYPNYNDRYNLPNNHYNTNQPQYINNNNIRERQFNYPNTYENRCIGSNPYNGCFLNQGVHYENSSNNKNNGNHHNNQPVIHYDYRHELQNSGINSYNVKNNMNNNSVGFNTLNTGHQYQHQDQPHHLQNYPQPYQQFTNRNNYKSSYKDYPANDDYSSDSSSYYTEYSDSESNEYVSCSYLLKHTNHD